MSSQTAYVPLADAALARRETREVTLRRVMRGELQGERRAGRWFVILPIEAAPQDDATGSEPAVREADGRSPRRRRRSRARAA